LFLRVGVAFGVVDRDVSDFLLFAFTGEFGVAVCDCSIKVAHDENPLFETRGVCGENPAASISVHLRRERRWVRSAFGGEFNAALVAPFNSAE
jgi:hypothetical protein